MASIDDVKRTVIKVAKDIDKQTATGASTALSKSSLISSARPNLARKTAFVSFESRLMNSFHVGDPTQNQINISKFIISDTGCNDCVLLRILEHNLFRLYFRKNIASTAPETYNLDDFTCLQKVVHDKVDVVQTDEDYHALSLLVQWKPLFTYIPDVVVAIPILRVDQQVMAIVGLGFKKKLPSNFLANKLRALKDFLDTVVPYALTIQASSDSDDECIRMQIVLDSLDIVEKDKRDPIKCAMTIGSELGKMTGCPNIIVFIVDYIDSRMRKVYNEGKHKGAQWGCPQSDVHEDNLIEFDDKLPIGWAALHRKAVKLNEHADCADYNLSKKGLHSVAMCFCKNVLCVPVNDHSGEKTLVIELTDKEGGFNSRDVEISTLFAQNAASVYSCCIMLAHREKSSRRNSMLSQILLNIEPVKHMKVEQFLSHQRKNAQASLYTGPFIDFTFSIKNYSEWDMGGAVLFAFSDLEILSTFKVRRATLIRFILSTQQGYRPLPYHNWQHACSVTHFVYLLIKNLKLIEEGYLTRLQAFAMLVSAISHDVDHRGTNNRFQSCTNSDLFQLYNTQESILERHHLAIALSILRREDCNLIENLNPTDYKEFVELLTWNILATDISKYLQSRESNFRILRDFKKGEPEHTYALCSLMMTASDVNDSCKPWDDSIVSARHILTEFFEQGDMEKEIGMSPMPMMDRHLAYIPEVEFKFLSGIVVPVYKELAVKFVDLMPCLKNLRKCEEYWEYSTIIFDGHPEVENKLDILKWPEMKEENLKKLENDAKIRRLSDEQYKKARRGTMMSITELSKRTFVSKTIVKPESEFRMMFTDKPEPEEETTFKSELYEEESRSCCSCLRKKKK